MTLANARNSWVVDLSLLILFIGILFSLWLGSHPLFVPDEGRYCEAAREMVASGDYLIPRVNGVAFLDKPILVYWLQASAIKLFGLNEWSVHIWPALLGLIGCLMTYIAGRLIFNRRTGILGAVILASSPLYAAMARYANFDLAVAVFVDCALFCFIIAMKYAAGKERSSFLIAAYIFAGFAILTKGLIGIVFPIMIIGVWILCLNRWSQLREMHLIIGLLLVVAISTPWYFLAQHAIPQFFNYIFVKEQFLRFLTPNFNNRAPLWFYLPIVLIGLFPWVVFLAQTVIHNIQNVWRDKQHCSSEFFLLLWPLLIFIFFSLPSSKTIGYITPVLPPLALLIGHYLQERWGVLQIKGIKGGVVAFVVLALGIIIAAVSLPHFPKASSEIKNNLPYYLYFIALIFAVAAVILVSKYKELHARNVFFILCGTIVLTLATAAAAVPHAGITTIKRLALVINAHREPGDEIVSFEHYYQDLPFYVQGNVTAVTNWNDPSIPNDDDWQNQLWTGMQFEGPKPWLIDEPTFWQQWNSNKRIFVVFDATFYNRFKADAKDRFYFLAEDLNTYLITNKPI